MINLLDEKGISQRPIYQQGVEGGIIRAQPGTSEFVQGTSQQITAVFPAQGDITIRERFLELTINRDLLFRTFWLGLTTDQFTLFDCQYELRFFLDQEQKLSYPLRTRTTPTGGDYQIEMMQASGTPFVDAFKISRQSQALTTLTTAVTPHYCCVSANRAVIAITTLVGTTYGAQPDAKFFLAVQSTNYR